jgi:hypothetical protein
MNEHTERERKSLVVLVLKYSGELEQVLAKVVTIKMQTPTTTID